MIVAETVRIRQTDDVVDVIDSRHRQDNRRDGRRTMICSSMRSEKEEGEGCEKVQDKSRSPRWLVGTPTPAHQDALAPKP